MSDKSAPAVLSLRSAALRFGQRELWHDLDLDVHAGEFLAVIGPNGTGKTSLLKVILGQQKLTSGTISLLGEPVHEGNKQIGYIPQQKLIDQSSPLRARDLVAFGLNGHRFGLPISSRAEKARISAALEAVGASSYADAPVSSLSGGEQQRVRVGQSIVGDPRLLLCDEPLLSLDLGHQREVSELIDEQRRKLNTAVIFVTHDVNPVLGMVDRVLYLAGGKFRVGTPDEVLRTEVLSEMYGTPVDVIRTRGRIIVVGGPEEGAAHQDHPHHAGNGTTAEKKDLL